MRSLQTQSSRVDAERFEQERQAVSRACGHEVRAKPPKLPKNQTVKTRKARAASESTAGAPVSKASRRAYRKGKR